MRARVNSLKEMDSIGRDKVEIFDNNSGRGHRVEGERE